MTREIKIPIFVFILLALVCLTVVAAYFDALLYFEPKTQGLVIVGVGSKEPTFMDIVTVYTFTNLWEVFLVACGCFISWKTRNKFVTVKIP